MGHGRLRHRAAAAVVCLQVRRDGPGVSGIGWTWVLSLEKNGFSWKCGLVVTRHLLLRIVASSIHRYIHRHIHRHIRRHIHRHIHPTPFAADRHVLKASVHEGGCDMLRDVVAGSVRLHPFSRN